jgi:signal transduction histidine kinase
VEIGKIMNEATGLIRAALPKNITLSCSCSPECPPVMASETRLIQLLMNLCINAGHAIGSDRGTITLNAEPDQTAPGIILTVQDTGCGMARDIIEHMYEPYFTTKGRDEGTGLGLAIVHGIVKNHGGRIRVSSEPKKGTTFTIRLPAS